MAGPIRKPLTAAQPVPRRPPAAAPRASPIRQLAQTVQGARQQLRDVTNPLLARASQALSDAQGRVADMQAPVDGFFDRGIQNGDGLLDLANAGITSQQNHRSGDPLKDLAASGGDVVAAFGGVLTGTATPTDVASAQRDLAVTAMTAPLTFYTQGARQALHFLGGVAKGAVDTPFGLTQLGFGAAKLGIDGQRFLDDPAFRAQATEQIQALLPRVPGLLATVATTAVQDFKADPAQALGKFVGGWAMTAGLGNTSVADDALGVTDDALRSADDVLGAVDDVALTADDATGALDELLDAADGVLAGADEAAAAAGRSPAGALRELPESIQREVLDGLEGRGAWDALTDEARLALAEQYGIGGPQAERLLEVVRATAGDTSPCAMLEALERGAIDAGDVLAWSARPMSVPAAQRIVNMSNLDDELAKALRKVGERISQGTPVSLETLAQTPNGQVIVRNLGKLQELAEQHGLDLGLLAKGDDLTVQLAGAAGEAKLTVKLSRIWEQTTVTAHTTVGSALRGDGKIAEAFLDFVQNTAVDLGAQQVLFNTTPQIVRILSRRYGFEAVGQTIARWVVPQK